jgi:heme/copper-type cytochrome/quinol oxidase subunit 2
MKVIHFIFRKKIYLLAGIGILIIALVPLPISKPAPRTVTIPIQAKSFAFSPGIVKVNQGDRVIFELTSTDVVHGLHLENYDLSMVSDPGQTTSLNFIADKQGTFRFRCSVTCGNLHPFMMGKLKVGTNELAWRSSAIAVLLGAFGIWRIRND